MNRTVKIILLIITCFFVKPILSNAENCEVYVLSELNQHASHVTYDLSYSKTEGTFSITVTNLNSKLMLEYDSKRYDGKYSTVTINNIIPGTSVNLEIHPSSYSSCDTKDILRTITFQAPYHNNYLDSDECINYPELTVCKTEFFGYDLTYDLFQNMLEKQRIAYYGEEEQEEEIEEPNIIIEFLKKYAKLYGMQTLLFVLGTGSMFILGHSAVKRAKAKF